jgi:hypothetical protein
MHWYRILFALTLEILASVGCARRIDLTHNELSRVENRVPGPATLRAFPSKRMLSEYREKTVFATYEVGKRRVRERATFRPRVRLVAKRTPGRVLAKTEVNGITLLWVDFFGECEATACAYGFVLTEAGTFSLKVVPDLADYDAPTTYRCTKVRRNRIMPMKRRSLGEPNDVLAAPRKRGPKTIDLVIRKDMYRPSRTDVERARGVD